MGGSGKRIKDPEKMKEKAGAQVEKKDERKKQQPKEVKQFSIVRVAGTDLNGDKPVALAITKIKGVGWTMSNAICKVCGFDPAKKLSEMGDDEVARLEEAIKNPLKFGIPSFILNRPRDVDTGDAMHLTGTDLQVATKFDVERFVNLRTYRGWRHMMGQPVRGQRTRSKFREKGRVVGVLRKSVRIATGQAEAPAAQPAGKKEEKK